MISVQVLSVYVLTDTRVSFAVKVKMLERKGGQHQRLSSWCVARGCPVTASLPTSLPVTPGQMSFCSCSKLERGLMICLRSNSQFPSPVAPSMKEGSPELFAELSFLLVVLFFIPFRYAVTK